MFDELPLKVIKEAYSKKASLREGKLSKLASEAEGLASTDPELLLKNLGLGSFRSEARSKAGKVVDLFRTVRESSIGDGEKYLSLIFDDIEQAGDSVSISLHVIRTKNDKSTYLVSQRTLKSIVGSILLAAAKQGKIEWDENGDFIVSKYDNKSRGKVTITCK
jgi:hypothetical protein